MEQMSLFDNRITSAPLASRLRPETLQDYVGQKHLLGEGKMLRRLIEQDQISSMILLGASWCRENYAGADHCRYDKG